MFVNLFDAPLQINHFGNTITLAVI